MRIEGAKISLAQLVMVSGHSLYIILSAPPFGTKSAVKAMILSALKREELRRLKKLFTAFVEEEYILLIDWNKIVWI